MPWKYLRILRRCTCVTPDLAGRGKMNMVQRFFGTAAFFLQRDTAVEKLPLRHLRFICYLPDREDPAEWICCPNRR